MLLFLGPDAREREREFLNIQTVLFQSVLICFDFGKQPLPGSAVLGPVAKRARHAREEPDLTRSGCWKIRRMKREVHPSPLPFL